MVGIFCAVIIFIDNGWSQEYRKTVKRGNYNRGALNINNNKWSETA